MSGCEKRARRDEHGKEGGINEYEKSAEAAVRTCSSKCRCS